MQKLVNRPEKLVDDSIGGFVKCHRDLVAFTDNPRTLKYTKAPVAGKVGVVTGGGYGHEPAFIGYIGMNMLDAVAIGDIFKPPSAEAFYAAFKAADAGCGVVCLYGNYIADIINANKAVELAAKDGITVKSVIASDDVAVTDLHTNRGMTGEVLLWKIGGAAAACGYGLDEVAAVCERAMGVTKSIGVGIASCIDPEVGRPNYLIEMGTMEIGVGHHGQSSEDTCKLKTADETADIMLEAIGKELPLKKGDKTAVMISGLGNTMLSELNILYGRVYDALLEQGIEIHRAFVGNFFTSLDMMGATLTVTRLDKELIKLLDTPSYPVAFSCFNKPL